MSAYTNRTLAVALSTLLTLFITSPAFGWGQTGHRITGAIAQQYLSPLSYAAVSELLPTSNLAQASTYACLLYTSPSPRDRG